MKSAFDSALTLPIFATIDLLLLYLILLSHFPDASLTKGFPVLLTGTVAALIAVFSNTKFDALRRQREEENVKKAVYQELLFLTFRCAWDFDDPWMKLLANSSRFNRPFAQKFRPDEPFVFRSLAGSLSLIPTKPLARVLRFHQALELWRRDLDYYVFEEKGEVDPTEKSEVLVKRLGDALQLGFSAVVMLREHVHDWQTIDSDFRASLKPVFRLNVKEPNYIESIVKRAAEEKKIREPLF